MNKVMAPIRSFSLLLKVAWAVICSEMAFASGNSRRIMGLLKYVAYHAGYCMEQASESPARKVCFVLGNGPSLAVDLKCGLDILTMGDVVCVNSFAETDLYEIVRPKYYVLADPGYWSAACTERAVAYRNNLFNQVLRKTKWPITIYAPLAAKGLLDVVFSSAQNIRLNYYNTWSAHAGTDILNTLYDMGLCMPVPQNVLIPALFLPLRLGYKTIVLLGADHSWHKSLVLDDTNRVCISQPHFYDSDAKSVPFSMGVVDESGERYFTMDKAFHAFATMFEGYWKLAEYAKYLGARVYNASSITFIDAFERKSIADLVVELADAERKAR